MIIRLSLKHPKNKCRVHGTVELPMADLPKKDEKMDLSAIFCVGLPKVVVTSTIEGTPPEVCAKLPSSMTGQQILKTFHQDYWSVYGV